MPLAAIFSESSGIQWHRESCLWIAPPSNSWLQVGVGLVILASRMPQSAIFVDFPQRSSKSDVQFREVKRSSVVLQLISISPVNAPDR